MLKLGLNVFLLIFINIYQINPTVGYYPGLRRQSPLSSLEDPSDILTQLIEEHARRRLQQQLAQQQFYNHHHHVHNEPAIDIDSESYSNGPGFTYSFPETKANGDNIAFAVNPSDPRFYEGRLNNNNNINGQIRNVDTYENEYRKDYSSQIEEPSVKNSNERDEYIKDVQYYKPKNPLTINPKPTIQEQFLPKPFRGRDDIKKLVQKLEAEGKANAILNGNQHQPQLQEQQQLEQIQTSPKNNEVIVRQHMGMENDMGMYMVALLAGITAAITVGIMALIVAWITLQRRTKAAADVEYPAYGVTGPNKDISPSGDRRLAQSAQMYHYQHQKQQIIAMENRQSGSEHHSGGLSDVESDDDNEEGDYTVYECPGLAPTGEMEVKNPLFVDDTPITPITNTTTPSTSTSTTTTTSSAPTTTDNTKLTSQEKTSETVFQKVQKSPMKPSKQSQPPPAPQRKPPRSNGSNNSDTGNKANKNVK